MTEKKATEWIDNTFSEYTAEEDRKEAIVYLIKKIFNDNNKKLTIFSDEINEQIFFIQNNDKYNVYALQSLQYIKEMIDNSNKLNVEWPCNKFK